MDAGRLNAFKTKARSKRANLSSLIRFRDLETAEFLRSNGSCRVQNTKWLRDLRKICKVIFSTCYGGKEASRTREERDNFIIFCLKL